jgi:hypothetical protein
MISVRIPRMSAQRSAPAGPSSALTAAQSMSPRPPAGTHELALGACDAVFGDHKTRRCRPHHRANTRSLPRAGLRL